ncbi:MAG: hypothetical protein HKN27_16240 [Silicimonas sp.]|nr:hypothetical protein [Silicimonas sp.]
MATGAKPIVYQERKRLAFVAVMAFLAGFLFYIRTDLYIGGVHVALITGSVYAVIIGICALIVCIVLPSMRFMIEAVAVSRLILSLFVLAVPNMGYLILSNPLVTALVTVTGGIAVSRLIHGRIRRDTPKGIKGRLMPANMFKRLPVSVQGKPWQQRFVGWLEDAEPIPVRVSR